MVLESKEEHELDALIMKFSILIRTYIRQFRVMDFGVDPEDIVQEVHIRLWKTLRNKNLIHKPSSYIRKVVSTVVIDQLRKFKRDEGLLVAEKRKHISESSQYYLSRFQSDNRDPQLLLEDALNSLIITRRTVVKLYFLNMRVSDIASTFDWSINKTRNLLYRGLADLKKALKQNETYYDQTK
jgi:RNA polymerase sigma factor (sigma-70 family)